MKKIIISGIVVVVFVAIIVFVANFSLFDDDKPVEIKQFDSTNPKYKIAVLYRPSNATVQDGIIVQKVYENGSRKLLSVYDRYQVLIGYKILGDSLEVILADTSSYEPRMDTIKIGLVAKDNN